VQVLVLLLRRLAPQTPPNALRRLRSNGGCASFLSPSSPLPHRSHLRCRGPRAKAGLPKGNRGWVLIKLGVESAPSLGCEARRTADESSRQSAHASGSSRKPPSEQSTRNELRPVLHLQTGHRATVPLRIHLIDTARHEGEQTLELGWIVVPNLNRPL
jgi:hypothetical protein